MTTLVGIVLGVLAATAVIQLHSRFLVPDYLQNVAILSLVMFVFAVSNHLQEESGLATVTVMGLLLANQPWVAIHHVLEFKENLRVLLISVLFIVLSSRVEISGAQLAEFGVGGCLFVAAMILLILLGGHMFAGVFFAAGGMATVQSMLMATGLEPWAIIGLILLIAFLAGFVLDMMSVVLIVIPVAMPVVRALGFDDIWFCVAFLVVLQTSYLTPPLAPSIFYLRAITPPEITLKHMYLGVIPFIVIQLIVLAVVLFYEPAVMWLPGITGGPSW